MLRKRNIVVLSVGLLALMAFWPKDELLRAMRARHVSQTVFVSAGNLRLAGFFDGLAPDPRLDAKKALQRARSIPHCKSSPRRGLFGWLPALFERTAYAQQACQPVGCGGGNCYSNVNSNDCTAPDCGAFTYTVNDNNSPCQGTDFNGFACVSDADGCVGQGNCNWATCGNGANCGCGGGGGGCEDDDSTCSSNSDCCSGTCVDGECGYTF